MPNNNERPFNRQAISRAFKAYDVRGRIPDELNAEIIKFTGNAFIQFLKHPRHPIVIGYDVRPTSKTFAMALITGITDAGANVIDIGLVGTDMVYYATAVHKASGGIMITASHNPADYNGLKFVRSDAIPISGETGLMEIRDFVLERQYHTSTESGKVESLDITHDYIDHILKFVNVTHIPAMKVVLNAGNGCAGAILPHLLKKIPQIEAIQLFWKPDGTFPNGIPNPLLPERRADTTRMVRSEKADLGVAWDGDFDRCFFYDENGEFIDGYYIVALFSQFFVRQSPGAKIIHDPRLVWATQEVVASEQGIAIEHRAGHAFIKDRMRAENALYAGEMSAHHYFRDNFFADNGMIPMLLLWQILGQQKNTTDKISLRVLVQQWIADYPISGEINIQVTNVDAIFTQIQTKYIPNAIDVKYIDGLSVEYKDWRFSLRKSNTEPVIRLNVESRGNVALMEQKRDELLQAIQDYDD